MTTITREHLELAAKAANLQSVGTALLGDDGAIVALELIGGPHVVRMWKPHIDPADAWQLAADCKLVIDFPLEAVFAHAHKPNRTPYMFGGITGRTAMEAVTLAAAEIGRLMG